MNEFDDLYNQTLHNSDIISKSERSGIVDYIKAHKEHHDNIYSLIKIYQMKYDIDQEGLLYQSKILKNGNLRINLDNLPNHLQNILFLYINKSNALKS